LLNVTLIFVLHSIISTNVPFRHTMLKGPNLAIVEEENGKQCVPPLVTEL